MDPHPSSFPTRASIVQMPRSKSRTATTSARRRRPTRRSRARARRTRTQRGGRKVTKQTHGRVKSSMHRVPRTRCGGMWRWGKQSKNTVSKSVPADVADVPAEPANIHAVSLQPAEDVDDRMDVPFGPPRPRTDVVDDRKDVPVGPPRPRTGTEFEFARV